MKEKSHSTRGGEGRGNAAANLFKGWLPALEKVARQPRGRVEASLREGTLV